jgi:hypothetical protein
VNAQLDAGDRSPLLSQHLGAMQSLRDVDSPASIRVGAPEQLAILRSLLHA